MQGVLLAGGNGGRLRPLTSDTAKAMVEVADRPMIDYCLDRLSKADIDEVIIVVGYLGKQIINHIGDYYDGIPIKYVNQQQQLGTAHALLKASDYITDDFVLMYPDNIYSSDFELCDLIEVFEKAETGATILINQVSVEIAEKSGVVCRDSGGDITEVVEKPDNPPSTRALCGTYIFSLRFLEYCEMITLSNRGEYEITDALDILLENEQNIAAMELENWVININTPEDRDKAEKRLSAYSD